MGISEQLAQLCADATGGRCPLALVKTTWACDRESADRCTADTAACWIALAEHDQHKTLVKESFTR